MKIRQASITLKHTFLNLTLCDLRAAIYILNCVIFFLIKAKTLFKFLFKTNTALEKLGYKLTD